MEVAIPAEIENIHAVRTGGGGDGDGDGGDTILLYYGEHDFVFPNATCTGDNRTNPTEPVGAIAASHPNYQLSSHTGGNPYPRHDDRIGIVRGAHLIKLENAVRRAAPSDHPILLT